MCGIFGAVNTDLSDEKFLSILRKLNHRGPDDEGFICKYIENNKIFLGHTRLSVLDLTLGKQPMISKDENLILIYNGEIYNHLELRKEIEKKGLKFFTKNSDTEVLLNAYKLWGESFVKKLNGMWAFCIFDIKEKKLFISRDRFGEKPLFFKKTPKGIIFGSELKVFESIINDNRDQLSFKNLQKYCAYGFFPKNITPYKDIFKLNPGSNLVYDLKEHSFKENFFWKYSINTDNNISEDEWIYNLDKAIDNSVKNRMTSDRPIGVFLSGGLDSSLITNYASKIEKNLNTFAINFDEKSFDESSYSNLIAKKYSSIHNVIKFEVQNMNKYMTEFFNYIDEPISDSAILSNYELCKMAKKKIVVGLSGDGSDELFLGYDIFKASSLVEKLNNFKIPIFNKLFRNLASFIPTSYSHFNLKFKIQKFLSYSNKSYSTLFPEWLAPLSIDEINEIFYSNVGLEEIYEDAIEDWNLHQGKKNLNLLEKGQEFFINFFLSNQILVKSDRTSMFNSLELRLPFLDNDIVEISEKLPLKFKYKNNISKYILKKVGEKYFDQKFIYRKKVGFSSPLSKWFANNTEYKLKSKFLSDKKIFYNKIVSHSKKIKDERLFLWNFINLDNFLNKQKY